MSPPKGTKKRTSQMNNMRAAKRVKDDRERIRKEQLAMERALWSELESRMLDPSPEDCEEVPDSSDEPFPDTHWHCAGQDEVEEYGNDGFDSEEELEFTDSEELDLDSSKAPTFDSLNINSFASSSTSCSARSVNRNAFTTLMEDRKGKEEAIKAVHFKHQREAQPSKKTLTRRANDKKALASVAAQPNQSAIGSFLQLSSQILPPEEDPDHGKNIFVPAAELKAAISDINKKIKCKRKGMQLKGQNLFRHEAVKMFLLAQQTRQSNETRLHIAQNIVARCCGRGLYFARKVITWEIEWRERRTVNEGRKGCFSKTYSWFNDEGVQLHIRDYLAGAGEHITAYRLAKSIGDYLDSRRAEAAVTSALEANPEDPALTRRTRIRARTARRFLHKMGFSYKNVTKNVYVDGHERTDVVEYRNEVFLPRWHAFSRRFVVFNENGLGAWEFPKGLKMGEKPLVLVTHDESTFNANDGKRRLWVKDGKMPLRQKSRGKGIMISGFLTPGGPLRVPDHIPDSELLEDLYCKWPLKPDGSPIRDAFVSLEYGKDNYWTGEKMVDHLVTIAIPIFRKAFPCCQALFAFDNASNHMAYAEDALLVSRMNLSPGGASVPCMRETFMHGKGLPQHMVFPMNHEMPALRGKPKGIEQVLRERGLWRNKNAAGVKFRLQCPKKDGREGCPTNLEDPSVNECCARKVLSRERDFKDQLGLIAEEIYERGYLLP